MTPGAGDQLHDPPVRLKCCMLWSCPLTTSAAWSRTRVPQRLDVRLVAVAPGVQEGRCQNAMRHVPGSLTCPLAHRTCGVSRPCRSSELRLRNSQPAVLKAYQWRFCGSARVRPLPVGVVALLVVGPVVVPGRGRSDAVEAPVDGAVVAIELIGGAVVVHVAEVQQAVRLAARDHGRDPLARALVAVGAVADRPDRGRALGIGDLDVGRALLRARRLAPSWSLPTAASRGRQHNDRQQGNPACARHRARIVPCACGGDAAYRQVYRRAGSARRGERLCRARGRSSLAGPAAGAVAATSSFTATSSARPKSVEPHISSSSSGTIVQPILVEQEVDALGQRPRPRLRARTAVRRRDAGARL